MAVVGHRTSTLDHPHSMFPKIIPHCRQWLGTNSRVSPPHTGQIDFGDSDIKFGCNRVRENDKCLEIHSKKATSSVTAACSRSPDLLPDDHLLQYTDQINSTA